MKDAYQTWCYIRWIILVSIAMMLVGVFFIPGKVDVYKRQAETVCEGTTEV